jgi:hypothetical protein
MARAQTTDCGACPTGRVGFGETSCGTCGHPTTWASHDERVEWEVAQWRRARNGGGVTTIHAPALPHRSAESKVERPSNVFTLDPGTSDAADEPSFFSWLRNVAGRLRKMFVGSLKLDLDPIFEPPAAEEPASAAAPMTPLALVEPVAEAGPVPVAEHSPDEGRRPQLEAFAAFVAARRAEQDDPPAEEEIVAETLEVGVPAHAPNVAVTVEAAAAFIAAISSVRADAPEPAPAAKAELDAEAPAPAAPTPKPAVVRKKPNRPTNKDLLKRALEMLTKVEKRLEHLEQELEVPAHRAEDVSLDEIVGEVPHL